MDYDSSRSEVWHQKNGKWNAILECQTIPSIKYLPMHYTSAYHIRFLRKIFLITPFLEKFVCEEILVKWMRNKSKIEEVSAGCFYEELWLELWKNSATIWKNSDRKNWNITRKLLVAPSELHPLLHFIFGIFQVFWSEFFQRSRRQWNFLRIPNNFKSI